LKEIPPQVEYGYEGFRYEVDAQQFITRLENYFRVALFKRITIYSNLTHGKFLLKLDDLVISGEPCIES